MHVEVRDLEYRDLVAFFERITGAIERAPVVDNGVRVSYTLVKGGIRISVCTTTSNGSYSMERVLPWGMVVSSVADHILVATHGMLEIVRDVKRRHTEESYDEYAMGANILGTRD